MLRDVRGVSIQDKQRPPRAPVIDQRALIVRTAAALFTSRGGRDGGEGRQGGRREGRDEVGNRRSGNQGVENSAAAAAAGGGSVHGRSASSRRGDPNDRLPC